MLHKKPKQHWAPFTDSERTEIEELDTPMSRCLTEIARSADGSLWGLAHEVREFRAQFTSGTESGTPRGEASDRAGSPVSPPRTSKGDGA